MHNADEQRPKIDDADSRMAVLPAFENLARVSMGAAPADCRSFGPSNPTCGYLKVSGATSRNRRAIGTLYEECLIQGTACESPIPTDGLKQEPYRCLPLLPQNSSIATADRYAPARLKKTAKAIVIRAQQVASEKMQLNADAWVQRKTLCWSWPFRDLRSVGVRMSKALAEFDAAV